MQDFLFDIVAREIVLTDGTHGDFVTTTNPSVQDGGAILYSRGVNLRNPMVGIDIDSIVNGGAGSPTPAFDLNRWKSQALTDGATTAKWTAGAVQPNGEFAYTIQVSYL